MIEHIKYRGRLEAELLKQSLENAKRNNIPMELILKPYEDELIIWKIHKNLNIPQDLHVTEDNVFKLFYSNVQS